MKALTIVKEVITKKVIGKIKVPVRTGPKGYPLFLRLRLLVYGKIKGFFSTRMLVKHLEKRPDIVKKLDFETAPSKRTIDRWKKGLVNELKQLVKLSGDNYLQTKLSEWAILDSTPIEDEMDSEARVGYTSKGKFKGFKLHMSCDEHEVPLRAVVTTGNVHDSTMAEELLAPTKRTGGDSGYDNRELKKSARKIGSKPIFVHNPRRQGKEKKRKTPKILKKARVVIEQCNGFIKNQVMQKAWTIVKGLAAKTVFVLTAVLATQALALYNLKHFGYPSIRIQEMRV